jgi:hypothetical protein
MVLSEEEIKHLKEEYRLKLIALDHVQLDGLPRGDIFSKDTLYIHNLIGDKLRLIEQLVADVRLLRTILFDRARHYKGEDDEEKGDG